MIQRILDFFEFVKAVPIVDLSNIIIKVITICFIFIKGIFNSWYKYEMHEYYKVPKKYFEKNIFKVIEELLIEITFLLVILILICILEQKFSGNKLFELAELFILSIVLFLFIIINSSKYCKDLSTKKETIVYFFICLIGAISLVVLSWNIMHKNNNIFLYIVSIVAVFKVCTYIIKSSDKCNFKYRDECEFVKMNRKEYIIITHYENKVILQEIKYVNKKDNKISINRNYFKIVELNDLDIYTKKNLTVTNLVS